MKSFAHTLAMQPTTLADLDFVVAAERHPDNAPYVGQWTCEQHAGAITAQDRAHFIATCQGQRVGYVILGGFSDPHQAVHLQRIVVAEKKKGYGRQILQWLKRFTFETLGYHRLWFDVLEGNSRARHLYESEGFVVEGILRDSWKIADGGYQSMLIMSMLETEYHAPSPDRPLIPSPA
jgi:diamine N-acetyltransferase